MPTWKIEWAGQDDLQDTLQKLTDEGWKIFTVLVRYSPPTDYTGPESWTGYTIVAFRNE